MPNASYTELLALLDEYISAGRSITLTVSTENRKSGLISIRDGEIRYLSCGSKKGVAAIESLAASPRLGYHAIEGALDRVTPGLPRTEQILTMMRSWLLAAGADASLPVPPEVAANLNWKPAESRPGAPRPATPAPAVHRVPSRHGLQLALDRIREELALVLGPLADTLLHVNLRELGPVDAPDDLARLVTRLAKEIDDADDATAFVRKAMALVYDSTDW